MKLRQDAEKIIDGAIQNVLPDKAVIRALEGKKFGDGKIYLIAVGKAAWQMAYAACNFMRKSPSDYPLENGIVVTKYDYVMGEIEGITCFEAGHPVPDQNSFRAADAILAMTADLHKEDTVLFLLSGGGSALFESPLIPEEELSSITKQLLACGADIVEINTIRKRLSAVKGGRFANHCAPAKIFQIIISDILGDPLDMIASGPACADSSTQEEALAIVEKYHLRISKDTKKLLQAETPKQLSNVDTIISGSVRELCQAAAKECEKLGYSPMILTDQLNCEAKEAGSFLAAIAKMHAKNSLPLAFIAGGETIVHVRGKGKGGRNQELALSAAEGIAGLEHAAIFSVGSDGTDGPTDAAGGYVDGMTKQCLKEQGLDIYKVLEENDAYHALEKSGGLIMTGATGTNVNDVSVLLLS